MAQGAANLTVTVDIERASRPPAPIMHQMPAMPTGANGDPIKNLTVFVLPHSHDDTGWQRNVDQYFEEEVRYIYDTVVSALLRDTRRRFIFVETAYFMRWWREQTASIQADTKRLVQTGQIGESPSRVPFLVTSLEPALVCLERKACSTGSLRASRVWLVQQSNA